MLERRAFPSGLAALPLIGGGLRLIGSPTQAAVPVTRDLLDRYTDWLATEYGEALVEGAGFFEGEHAGINRDWRREWCQRNSTLNPRPDFGRFGTSPLFPPSTRAAVILSAAGVPLAGGRDV